MVDSVFRLTRDQIMQFAKTPQQVRFFENLQSSNIQLPDDITAIYTAIQDSAVTAELAFSSAMALISDLQRDFEGPIVFPLPSPEVIDDAQPVPLPCAIRQGWAKYTDATYTVGSPFAVAAGATVTLPNDAGTTFRRYLPDNAKDFYDSSAQKFTPTLLGEHCIFTLKLTLEHSAAGVDWLDLGLDVAGNIIANQNLTLAKSSGVPHEFFVSFPIGIDELFLANGASVKLRAGASNLSVYDIEYQIARTIENADS